MLLQIEKINTFYDKSHVIRDLSFHVDKGEVVVLMGRNGAGRSTTLKSIIGLTPPKTGEVLLNRKKINGQPFFKISRMGISYVPEERRIFTALTVEENLKMAMIHGRKGEWTLEKVYSLLERLGERKKQVARGLSGGERQMLAIARSLVANPEIILLDEPLEGLAPIVAQAIEAAIHEMKKQGMTILLVEQNLGFAMRVSDRCYILNDGKAVAEGSSDEISKNPELIKRYLAV